MVAWVCGCASFYLPQEALLRHNLLLYHIGEPMRAAVFFSNATLSPTLSPLFLTTTGGCA